MTDERNCATRIDSFLVSNSWEETFPDLVQAVLPRIMSDHFLIIPVSSPTPLRFENMWLSHLGFKELVGKW